MKVEQSELTRNVQSMKREGFDYLVKITAIDYGDHLEVVYFLRNLDKNLNETIEMDINAADPWVDTIVHYYKAADWYERELQEMFGVRIKGREARRLLLEKWDGVGYPLRKSFRWGEPYETV
jgi:NADH:ubiquinone oxidoreductase subunit C